MVPRTQVENPHDNGRGNHGSTTQKSLKIQVKWHLSTKFSSPAARLKGLRLGDMLANPKSATLTVSIVPVDPANGVAIPGESA